MIRILVATLGIAALAVGDQRAIPPEQWQTFTRTGVNHLMSISGLHVTMVSGLVLALVGGVWRRIPWLTLALPALKAAALAGIIGTDAVQAWIANQNAAQATADAAEAALAASDGADGEDRGLGPD